MASADFTIQNRETGEFFAGFSGNEVSWTKFAADAWQANVRKATAQADLLICCGIPAQRQVVAL